jgi:pyridoxine kinase
VVFENGEYAYYEHEKLSNSCHGTGDVYASAFVGALTRGNSAYESARIAAEYTLECIRQTATLDNHWYGAAFELAIPKLIELLK